MHKSSKRSFLNVIIISAILHILILLLFLLSDLDSSLEKYKNFVAAKKQAKVVFKDPKKKPPQKKLKVYEPKLVAGAASPAPSPSQIPLTIPQPKKLPAPVVQEKKPPEPKKPPTPTPTPEKPKAKVVEKKKAKSKKQPEPRKIGTPTPAQKTVEKKKLTLADIMKGFKKYTVEQSAQKAQPQRFILPGQQHFVTVVGPRTGSVTEAQLIHERHAAKLFECMGLSFKLLGRGFRLINKPEVSVVDFTFTLFLDREGKLVDLQFVKNSTNNQLNRFMAKVIQHASVSFPPLPKLLRMHDVCKFKMTIPLPVALIPSANLYSQPNNQL